MNFYRIKYGKTAVCFRTEEVFSKKEDVIKYALDNKLFEKKKEYYEAEKIFESDYVEYLRDRGNPSFCVNLKFGSKMII